MTTLLLIRHGESEANRDCIFAGQVDPKLTDIGKKQAQLTASYIAQNFKVDSIYSSDLARAYSTAESLGELLGMEIKKETKLREIDAGVWDGMEFDKIKELYPKEFDTWLNDIGNAACVGGECIETFGERIIKIITSLAMQNDGKTIAIATHATPIRVLQSYAQTGGYGEMKNIKWVSNASVTVVEYDGGWNFKAVSIDGHLSDIRTFLPESV